MKIFVERTPVGQKLSGHVYLYAYSESEEDCYFINSSQEKIWGIKLDYSPDGKTLFASTISDINDDNIYLYDSDRIMLESNISFHSFCEKMFSSRFKKSKNYNTINSSCVDAVIYALEVADIKLQLDTSYRCKHVLSFFYCPVPIITPKELIQAVKNYKVGELFALGCFAEYEETAEKIYKLTNADVNDELINSCLSIITEIDKIKICVPEHIKTFTNILEQMHDLITNPTNENIDKYREIANHFQNKRSIWRAALGILMAIFGIIASLVCVLEIAIGMSDDVTKYFLMSGLGCLITGMSLVMITCILDYRLPEITKKMLTLIAAVEQNRPDEKSPRLSFGMN